MLNLPRDSTCYHIAGPNTLRLSSKAIFGLYGSNMQNKEKSYRSMYCADKGKILVQVDQAGAEEPLDQRQHD